MSPVYGALVVLHRTYARLFRERDDDLIVTCRECLAELGLVCDSEGNPAWWDGDSYPWDATAKPGDLCYRPGGDWLPSWDEISHRRRVPRPSELSWSGGDC